MNKKQIWELGEKIATKFLLDKWYEFLEKNHHEKYWEIDLIFKFWEGLIFVEVKTRTWEEYWEWFEAVDERKLKKLIKTWELYCQKNWIDFDETRFDVISIELSKDLKNAKIKHLEKVV